MIDACFSNGLSPIVGEESHPGIAGLVHCPVVGSQVPAVWQASRAWQVTVEPSHIPPVQEYFWHRSDPVHAVPSATGGFEHAPDSGSHVPAMWHESLAVHVTAVPTQVPALQESPCVQGLPSLQPVPSGAVELEQAPVAGLQVPATWH
jgi:hypothetical protein